MSGASTISTMVYSRAYHACAIFESVLHNGRPILIVGGSAFSSSVDDKAEVWPEI